jgi:hypothetical protein
MSQTSISPASTYEDMVEYAREQSQLLGRYAAVVEVVCYMQSRSYRTVMIGVDPVRTGQRGRNTFVGVACQFRNGRPVKDA